jgi:hypothetical protein
MDYIRDSLIHTDPESRFFSKVYFIRLIEISLLKMENLRGMENLT